MRGLPPARLPVLAALAILAAAGALRLGHARDRDTLWRDEVYEVRLAIESPSVGAMLEVVRADGQPPGHYLLSRAVAKAFGEDALRARWHVLLAGWLTVLALMLLCRRWFGVRCALVTGLFAATSPYLVHYSAELRGYALFGILAVVHAGAYLRYRDRRTHGTAVVWALSAAAAAYVHYYALFLVLVAGVLSLTDRRAVAQAALAGAVFCLAYAPWMPALLESLRDGQQLWAAGDEPWDEAFAPAWLVLGDGAAIVTWAGLALGLLVFRLGKWPPRERTRFVALAAMGLGSSAVAWIVQTQGGRGFGDRYLLGSSLMLLPAALLYWSRAGTLGEAAVWRGLVTGRIYRIRPSIHLLFGCAVLGAAWLHQWTDPDGWTRRAFATHGDARRLIAREWREGDLVVANSRIIGDALAYGWDKPVRRGPRTHLEEDPAGRRAVDEDELARGIAQLQAEIGARLRAGGRVWYYTEASTHRYPLPSDPPPADDWAPTVLDRTQRRIHAATLAALEEHGYRTFLLDRPDDYVHAFRLALYRPK